MGMLNPGPDSSPIPRNDHRSFYSGRRFAYLSVLFTLFLSAPISLTAQSGSSQQPAAAQPQSQGQSAPPCSNAPPILKRGAQPDLPPCPDPPPDAADSTPNRLPNPAEPLIERARDAAFQFSQKLPNFICEEYMARYLQRGQDKRLLDIVSAEVINSNKEQESYRNVKIDQRPTDKGMEELAGSWSTGEFSSTLLDLFSPSTHAQFRSGGTSSISGFDAQVYDFRVQSENSHWRVQAEAKSVHPAYQGSVWVDPATARVLRIEVQASNIPPDFPMDRVESAVDYSTVRIAGTSFLLPVHAETLGCWRGAPECSHNIIDFRNYHEFKVDVRIGE